MENKHIIIILLIVIVVLAAAIGVVLFNQANAKNPTVVKITSDKKLTEGKDLSIKLTDLSENPINNEIVSVKITDKKGLRQTRESKYFLLRSVPAYAPSMNGCLPQEEN